MKRFHISIILLSVLSTFSLAQNRPTSGSPIESVTSIECVKNPTAPGCIESGNFKPNQIRVNETTAVPTEGTPSQSLATDSPTEFQEFVESGTGRTLPIFGYTLFAQVPSTFAPLDRIAVPSTYILGPGDELVIR